MELSEKLVKQARAFVEAGMPVVRQFDEAIDERRARIERAFSGARAKVLDHIFASPAWDATPRMREVRTVVEEYGKASDWVLSDLFKLAALSPEAPNALGGLLVGPALIHFSYRLVDDVIDSHDSYKSLFPTALGRLRADWGRAPGQQADNSILLAAVALLTAGGHLAPRDTLPDCFDTVAGALMELMPDVEYTAGTYHTLIQSKSVSYSRGLYGPVAVLFGDQAPALLRFLEQAFYVGQLLNDAHDFEDDRQRGQPNLFVLMDDAQASQSMLEAELGQLRALAGQLGPPVQHYAHTRLVSLANYLVLTGSGDPS